MEQILLVSILTNRIWSLIQWVWAEYKFQLLNSCEQMLTNQKLGYFKPLFGELIEMLYI